MSQTLVHPTMLRAALIRDGVWTVDEGTGRFGDFYHKACFDLKKRPMPCVFFSKTPVPWNGSSTRLDRGR